MHFLQQMYSLGVALRVQAIEQCTSLPKHATNEYVGSFIAFLTGAQNINNIFTGTYIIGFQRSVTRLHQHAKKTIGAIHTVLVLHHKSQHQWRYACCSLSKWSRK